MWKSVSSLAVLAACSFAFVAAAREDAASSPTKAKDPKSAIRWEGSVISARVVKDLATSIAWYEDVLGSTMYFDFRQGGWVELTTPVANTLIGLQQADAGREVRVGDATLMLGTTDIEAAEKHLKAKGVRCEPIVEIPQTVKLLAFFDADGHRLQLHQPFKG